MAAPLVVGAAQVSLALVRSTLFSCKAVTLSGTSAKVVKSRAAMLTKPAPRLFTAWTVSV
eukprot:scaffold67884_cov80-Phaeocystis_antarctica.AAC.2